MQNGMDFIDMCNFRIETPGLRPVLYCCLNLEVGRPNMVGYKLF